MNPADFLDIADRLKSLPSEAGLRTSIGRSYYALYNVVHGSLSSEGIRLEGARSDHVLLVYYLTKCNDRDADKIGSALRDLHANRIDADYDMDVSINVDRSKLAYNLAQRMVTRFNALGLAGVQRIAQLIRYVPPPAPRSRT